MRRQARGESINTYVAALRSIAEHCEYGAVLNDMLRDRLVCGIHDQGIQRRLLQQTDLTFDKALEVALASEAAEKDSKRLTDANPDKDLPNQIGKVRDLLPPSQPSNPKWGKPPGRVVCHNNTPQQALGRVSVPGVGESMSQLAVATDNTSVTTAKRWGT